MCTLFALLLSDFPAGSQNDSDLLKGLLTENFCHVCEATLIHESQRISHYEVCEIKFFCFKFICFKFRAAVIFLTLLSMLPGEKACTKGQDVPEQQS